MGRSRSNKRYGSVKGMGRTNFVPLWEFKKQTKSDPDHYLISAGTKCWVRLMGTKEWKEHRTKVGIVCHGYLWRNRTHYGFAQQDYEVKVCVGQFRIIPKGINPKR